MNRHPPTDPSPLQEEAQLQRLADFGQAGDAPTIDRYRYIAHAVRHAPVPAIPDDLAERMETWVVDQAEQARFEDWLLRVVLVLAAVLALAFAVPVAGAALRAIGPVLDGLPWGLLLTSATGLGLAALLDRALGRRRGAGLATS